MKLQNLTSVVGKQARVEFACLELASVFPEIPSRGPCGPEVWCGKELGSAAIRQAMSELMNAGLLEETEDGFCKCTRAGHRRIKFWNKLKAAQEKAKIDIR